MRMSNKIEQNLQFKDARCCEGNSKKCSDNISNIEQLLNMAICNTTSLELEFSEIVLKEQDTRYNVRNLQHKKDGQKTLNKEHTANDNSLTQCIDSVKATELQQTRVRA